MTYAPIALFAYNRPEHLQKTVDALRKNTFAAESELFVFSDGVRADADRPKVESVRSYAKTISGFKSVNIIERPENFGLAKSIIAGVSELVERYGIVIVLEDDMVTSPHFLQYMNEALEIYKDDERVISIHGYVYPVKAPLPEAFFLRGADCWGWATWQRGWKIFESDGAKLLRALESKNLTRRFDFNGSYPYTQMLRDQIKGANDSWAIRWYASAFLADKLTLYPGRSLVHNIGNDQSGRHAAATSVFDSQLSATPIKLNKILVEESSAAVNIFEGYFRSLHEPLLRRLKAKIKRFLPKRKQYGFLGSYKSWEAAKAASTGYDSPAILEKISKSVAKVQSGAAAFERDSVAFAVSEANRPLLDALLYVAADSGNSLTVADFGGSLASAFFQHLPWLKNISKISWNVIEQPHFVERGRALISDARVQFFNSLDECVSAQRPDVILLSSVLQYLEDPYQMLRKIMDAKSKYILIDRTPFVNAGPERLTVQYVPPHIYNASYPAWLFDQEKFISAFSERYEIVSEHINSVSEAESITLRGFLLKIKN